LTPSIVTLGEQAGRLDHHLDPEIAPRQLGGIALREHFDLAPIDRDRPLGGLDPAREAPEGRVELEQMRKGVRVRDVVDGDEVEVCPRLVRGPEQIAPDAAEPVDPHPDCHLSSCLVVAQLIRLCRSRPNVADE